MYTFAPEMELGEKREVFLEVYVYGNKSEGPQHHANAGFISQAGM